MGALFARLLGVEGGFRAAVFASGAAKSLAMLTIMVGAFTLLINTINSAITGLFIVLPSWVTIGASWVVPSNIDLIISAYITGRIAIALYRWHKQWLASTHASFKSTRHPY